MVPRDDRRDEEGRREVQDQIKGLWSKQLKWKLGAAVDVLLLLIILVMPYKEAAMRATAAD